MWRSVSGTGYPFVSVLLRKDSLMKKEICSTLAEIEKLHNVKILYACESGSRAWGFPSPDSDYDARYLYIRPLESYLKLFPERDVIEGQRFCWLGFTEGT